MSKYMILALIFLLACGDKDSDSASEDSAAQADTAE